MPKFMNPLISSSQPLTLIALPDFCVVTVQGEDAATFLHGQLTNDITGLPDQTARLAAYCTPKGRVLATLVVWRAHDGTLHILMPRDGADDVLKRLRMFVLRARVTFSLLNDTVWGVQPNEALSARPGTGHDHPLGVDFLPQGTLIQAPGSQRWWFVASGAFDPATDAPAVQCGVADADTWHAGDIVCGLPWVRTKTRDTFLPQTLNLDLINGVSFTKGCYPGQEVVARAHYRGTVKRRMALGKATINKQRLDHLISGDPAGPGLDATPTAYASMLAGTDLFSPSLPDTPCGRVIVAALPGITDPHTVDQAMYLLLEVQISDLENKSEFRLGQPAGPILNVTALVE